MGVFPPLNPLYQTWTDNSFHPETSTSMDGSGAPINTLENGNSGDTSKSTSHDTTNITDSKVLRRLAQNREAARKSRLRKKAYVQQLESSRVKLNKLEKELERVRQQQGISSGHLMTGDATSKSNDSVGVAAFSLDYARWVEQQNRQVSALRNALANHASDNDLQLLIGSGKAHYDELFRLKDAAVKADVFHIMSGVWRTPVERCFMWMGGFRPSELLKILIPVLEPLSEQQLLALCNLQQSSQQAEDDLSHSVESLQQNLGDTLAAGFSGGADVSNFMGQMSMAMGKLGTLEKFVHQADNLRQQAFQQMLNCLTIHQAARGLLALGDYFSRLRALSSVWMARPRP